MKLNNMNEQTKEINNLINEAADLYSNKKYKEALDILQECKQKIKDNYLLQLEYEDIINSLYNFVNEEV